MLKARAETGTHWQEMTLYLKTDRIQKLWHNSINGDSIFKVNLGMPQAKNSLPIIPTHFLGNH